MNRVRLPKGKQAQRIVTGPPVPAETSRVASGADRIVQLQRFGGNRAVAQLVTAAVQRDPGNPVELVQKAIASSSLDQLITVQHNLRAELAKEPLNPPEPVRAALATARHWTMDRVAAIRDTYAPVIEALGTGGAAGTDTTGERAVHENLMDDECTPYLTALMEGHPEYRYEHFNEDVQKKVFAAVRLRASRRGLAQIGHRAAAEAEARSEAGLPAGSWCGAFAYTQAGKAGGFDPRWKSAMHGEGGIRSALGYLGDMANTWIWAFDNWVPLREYHARRGSERWYETIDKAPPKKGIEPGDLVLIDNSFGTDPDHITTAVSFDGRFLRTVGGNQGTASPTDETGVSATGPFDLTQNSDANDVTLYETGPDGKKKAVWVGTGDTKHRVVDASKGPKNKRVHGVGRWSVVDFEIHVYRVSPEKPPKPPTAKELAAVT